MSAPRVVPAAESPLEAIRLLDEFARSTAEAGPPWGPAVAHGELERVRAGTSLALLWIGPGDEAAGIAWGDPPGELGRRITVHLGPGMRSTTALGSFVDALAPHRILEVAETFVGLDRPAVAAALVPRGFVRAVRADLAVPDSVDVPLPDPAIGVRPLRADDAPALARLLVRAYSTNPVDTALFRERRDLSADAAAAVQRLVGGELGPWLAHGSFGVDRDGTLVAATVANEYLGALITEVMTDPAHRREGLARALLAATVAGLRTRPLRPIRLVVTLSNRGAVALYRKMGFAPVPGSTGGTWLAAGPLGLVGVSTEPLPGFE